MSRICRFITITLFSFSLIGCGPSQEELNATATRQAADTSATRTAAAPTATSTSTPEPTSTTTPTLTPTPSTGSLHVAVSWAESDEPVVGAVLNINELEITTDSKGQGIFKTLDPGEYSITLYWGFGGVEEIPCTRIDFGVEDWFGVVLQDNQTGEYILVDMSTSDTSVSAGETTQLDLQLICY